MYLLLDRCTQVISNCKISCYYITCHLDDPFIQSDLHCTLWFPAHLHAPPSPCYWKLFETGISNVGLPVILWLNNLLVSKTFTLICLVGKSQAHTCGMHVNCFNVHLKHRRSPPCSFVLLTSSLLEWKLLSFTRLPCQHLTLDNFQRLGDGPLCFSLWYQLALNIVPLPQNELHIQPTK